MLCALCALWDFVATWALANTAPAAKPVPCAQNHCPARKTTALRAKPLRRALEGAAQAPARCPRTLEWAARAPAPCPGGTRRRCSSPHSVAPERSNGLLEPPLGAPECAKGLLQPPLGAPGALEGAAQACSVPPVCAQRHFEPLLGAAGGSRATSWILGRSRRRSRMLCEESVLGCS